MPTKYPPVALHGAIEKAFDDVYWVWGTVRMAPLVRITRMMTVLAHEDELTLVNSVRLDEDTEAELKKLGRIAHVMKIGTHGMDDAYYVTEHGAKMWALRGASLSGELSLDEEIDTDAPMPIPDLEPFVFEHTTAPEAALLLKRHGGVLITCDSLQNWMTTQGCSPMGAVAAHAMGFMKPAQIGPPWRKSKTPEGGTLRPDFDRIAGLEFEHLMPGHGQPLKGGARARVAETIRRIYG